MSIVEFIGGPITHRYLMNKSKYDLASMYMDLLRIRERELDRAAKLYDAAAKHLEWIEKEHAGPDYGGLTRDTHPDGERIWRLWWGEQLDLCADTERLCRDAVAKDKPHQETQG